MKKNTQKTLLFSILALVLCVAMLAGTTFAWFTDTVTTGKNTIKAGKLDVELYHGTGSDPEKVGANTKLFQITKWEPGMAAYEKFTVKNEGNLALKFQMTFNDLAKNTTRVGGHSLTDVLYVKTSPSSLTKDALTKAAGTPLSDYASITLGEGHLSPRGAQDVYVYIYWPATDITLDANGDEETNNDNLLNVNKDASGNYMTSDNKALNVKLTINLNATQYAEEDDSFGKDYDANVQW